MTNWLMAVTGTVDPAVDRAAFDDWYDNVHLPEIAACPGIRRGTRYEAPHSAEGPPAFLTLYELEGPEAVDSELFRSRRGWGPFTGQVTFTTRLVQQRAVCENADR